MTEHQADTAVVRFERIGRNHNVADMTVKGDPTDLDAVAEQVFQHARGHLGSRWFEVLVGEDGTVLIEFGRFGRGSLVLGAAPVQRVHNHPPYRPVCNERTVDGQLRGACLNDYGSDRG